jgi:hypothetical protein
MRPFLRHTLTLIIMLITLFVAMMFTVEMWYTPMEPEGDSDGYLIAVISNFILIAPLVTASYLLALVVSRSGRSEG